MCKVVPLSSIMRRDFERNAVFALDFAIAESLDDFLLSLSLCFQFFLTSGSQMHMGLPCKPMTRLLDIFV